ncbi:MAG: TolC family protein [Acidobacteria bacterium]|nr:TolC family protein [Acidobacteriota bacterium]
MHFTRYYAAIVFVLAVGSAAGQQTSAGAAASGELSLEQVLSLALTRNPELAAAEREILARGGRAHQAAALPNPQLAGISENLGGDDVLTGGVQSTLQLEQLVELGGDRSARRAMAGAALELARWDLAARGLDVVARATSAFGEVLAAQRHVELAEDTVRLAEEVRATVAARVEAGKVSPIEETRAEVALATERIERDRAVTELSSARSRLAAIWGDTTVGYERVAGELDATREFPPLDEILARLDRAPDLARWDAEIAEREAILESERARAIPDLTLSGGYREFELGTNAWVASASFALPLFDQNRGAKTEASERIARAREERRAASVRIRQKVGEAHGSLVRSENEVRNLRDEVVPRAESVYDAISEGYRLGKFGYMEVLDARRTLAAARGQLLHAQADLWHAAAELQRLTSTPTIETSNGERQ